MTSPYGTVSDQPQVANLLHGRLGHRRGSVNKGFEVQSEVDVADPRAADLAVDGMTGSKNGKGVQVGLQTDRGLPITGSLAVSEPRRRQ